MASYNRVILMGDVTRDIELRYTPAGTPVTEVGMAVNDRRKNQNGDWVDETTFVDVTFWSHRTSIVGIRYNASMGVKKSSISTTLEKQGHNRALIVVKPDH